MVQGVVDGYEKKLQVIGVGWNAQAQGKTLRLNVGYCHPVDLQAPEGVEFKVDGEFVSISGPDKEQVGVRRRGSFNVRLSHTRAKVSVTSTSLSSGVGKSTG